MARTVESATAELTQRGYVSVTERDGIRVGDRCYGWDERYLEAHKFGTANVVAVFWRLQADDHENVEVIVERTEGARAGEIGVWAGFATSIVINDD